LNSVLVYVLKCSGFSFIKSDTTTICHFHASGSIKCDN
jgi:hypothetical protein